MYYLVASTAMLASPVVQIKTPTLIGGGFFNLRCRIQDRIELFLGLRLQTFRSHLNRPIQIQP
jgi:hypothetical protein